MNGLFSNNMLLFMPLGGMHRKDSLQALELVDGAPDFPELMSMVRRFLHQCHIVKMQVEKLSNHVHS